MKTQVRHLTEGERQLMAEEVGLSEPTNDIPIFVAVRGDIKTYDITSQGAINQMVRKLRF